MDVGRGLEMVATGKDRVPLVPFDLSLEPRVDDRIEAPTRLDPHAPLRIERSRQDLHGDARGFYRVLHPGALDQ